MATFSLSPQFVRPYVVSFNDYTDISDYGGPEQRRYRSLRIAGTAEAGTGDTDLVDTGAFTGYTTAGLQKARVAVIARDSIYSISSRTDADNLVIAKILGDGSFANGDAYRIMLIKFGFDLSFNAMTAAERDTLITFWNYHGRYETFTWQDVNDSQNYTVRFEKEPQIQTIAMASTAKIYSADVSFIEVI